MQSGIFDDEDGARDVAYYLIKSVMTPERRNGTVGDRIEYALGYSTKTAANTAYKAVAAKIHGAAKN